VLDSIPVDVMAVTIKAFIGQQMVRQQYLASTDHVARLSANDAVHIDSFHFDFVNCRCLDAREARQEPRTLYCVVVINDPMKQSHVSALSAVEPGSYPHRWYGSLTFVERKMLIQGPALR